MARSKQVYWDLKLTFGVRDTTVVQRRIVADSARAALISVLTRLPESDVFDERKLMSVEIDGHWSV